MNQDDEDFEPDETAIECYTTPLDEKDCVIDEYVKFKNTLSGNNGFVYLQNKIVKEKINYH